MTKKIQHMSDKMTYEEAMEKLETLARQMEQGQLPIDALAEKLKEAQSLIDYCKKRLLEADEAVKKILESKE